MGMKSFIVRQSVDFGQTSKFLIRPGDILVYDSSNQNKVTVYRNDEIVKVLPNQSSGGLTGLAKSGWIVEIHAHDASKQSENAPKSPVPAPQKPPAPFKAPSNGKGATLRSVKPQAPPKKVADSGI